MLKYTMQDCRLLFVNPSHFRLAFHLTIVVSFLRFVSGMPAAYDLAPGPYLFINAPNTGNRGEGKVSAEKHTATRFQGVISDD